jgi:hypothetical protein
MCRFDVGLIVIALSTGNDADNRRASSTRVRSEITVPDRFCGRSDGPDGAVAGKPMGELSFL